MEPNKASNRSIIVKGLLGGVIATIVNLCIFIIAKVSSISFQLPSTQEGHEAIELNVIGITIATIIPALGAVAIMLLLNRIVKQPLKILIWISIIFLLVSFFPVFSIDAEKTIKILLGSMHVIAAAGILFGLTLAFRSK